MPINRKGKEEETPIFFGRLKNDLKCGIVGLPNVGKSSFFNVLTKSTVAAENFPFCTANEVNEGLVSVPDKRWEWLCDYYKPTSKVPAFLKVIDAAGLVKGAHQGQGLGNAFLSNISLCDALLHVIRAFEDQDVIHVEGSVDPVRDMQIVFDELRLKDLEEVKRNLEALEKVYVRGGDKTYKTEYEVLQKVLRVLDQEMKGIRFATWDAKESEELNKHLFITAKPTVYLVNISEKDFIKRQKVEWLVKIKQWVDANTPGSSIFVFSCAHELNLIDMSRERAEAYCKENGTCSVLDKIILKGYKALELVHFFTAGQDEVRAWTIEKATNAPQAAGRIHSDLEKNFRSAEVMKYDDFESEGSEARVKAEGKCRQQGNDYIVEDGDIIYFK